MKTKKITKVYSRDEKIKYYFEKLEHIAVQIAASESVYEIMFQFERGAWIVRRLRKIMNES